MNVAQFQIVYNHSLRLWMVWEDGMLVVSLPTESQAVDWATRNADY